MTGEGSAALRWLDRFLKGLRPAPDLSYRPALRPVAEELWVVERRLRVPPGMLLPTRMTVVRLPGGGLWLHSPVPPDETIRKELAALGPVRAIVAPNPFHHLFVPDAVDAFPEATLFATPDLAERVPELPRSVALAEQAPALWAGVLAQTLFGPVGPFTEVVFLHRPSATLILTDLAFHMRRIDGAGQRLAWRAFGVPRGFGPSRTARWTLLRDRTVAAGHLERILRWDFARVLVTHGEPLEEDAPGTFRRAFARYLGSGNG